MNQTIILLSFTLPLYCLFDFSANNTCLNKKTFAKALTISILLKIFGDIDWECRVNLFIIEIIFNDEHFLYKFFLIFLKIIQDFLYSVNWESKHSAGE